MERRRKSGRPGWGIILLVTGLIVLLGNLGYLDWIHLDRWWPVILIVIGLWMVVRRSPSSPLEASLPAPTAAREFPTGGVILIGLGVAFLLNDVIIGGRALPALILMAVGAALVLRERFS